tara:strand:+ start:16668 stop:18251 length:1584 start_codon:yes stop_codon:yes gene_type:complete
MNKRQQVLIVGGGPVGMGLAIELGLRGISCGIVERRTEPHRIPKGQNLMQRTLDHFDSWGIIKEMRAARVMPPESPIGGITTYGDLMSEYWYSPPQREVVKDFFFQANERIPQYLLEEVLQKKLADLPTVETYFGWQAEALAHNDSGVTLAIAEANGGESQSLEADYLVGCDGAHSMVRDAIGIVRKGSDFDQKMVLAVFRSTELHEGLKRFPERSTYRAMDPELNGYWQFFGRIDVGEGWFFHAPVPMDTTVDNYDFKALIQKAAGFEFACEFDHVGFWDLRVAVAETYQIGRVFIAGDAAHSHPPYGGFGVNNGLEDARNLGWKLAARLQGWGSDALLDSYSVERHPIFKETGEDFIAAGIERENHFLSTYNPEKDLDAFLKAWEDRQAGAKGTMLSYEPNYEGSAVIDGPEGGVCSAHGNHSFDARAGHHLAPLELSSGKNIYEELSNDFTLLALDGEDAVNSTFEDAAKTQGIPFSIINDSYADGRTAYESRYILIRPDHYIVWCGDGAPADTAALMAKVVGK